MTLLILMADYTTTDYTYPCLLFMSLYIYVYSDKETINYNLINLINKIYHIDLFIIVVLTF